MAQQKMTYDQWWQEGERRFGSNVFAWRFVCPSCGNIATLSDFEAFKAQGASPNSATNQCIGRYMGATDAFDPSKHKPCNYAGYGLFHLSPVIVVRENGTETESFAFA